MNNDGSARSQNCQQIGVWSNPSFARGATGQEGTGTGGAKGAGGKALLVRRQRENGLEAEERQERRRAIERALRIARKRLLEAGKTGHRAGYGRLLLDYVALLEPWLDTFK